MPPTLATLRPEALQHLLADDAREATVHQWSLAEINALRLAQAAERPLLVRGEPGTGKTQLARAAADHLGWRLHAVTIHPGTDAQDLVYRFDAIKRLADAQARRNLDETSYIEPGPLWRAYDWASAVGYGSLRVAASKPANPALPTPTGHVVLIDEIDKADSDLPNSLLEVLGQRSLHVPPLNRTIGGPAAQRPLVIITSNEERELPSAFVRRCMVLNLMPDSSISYQQWLLQRGQAHYSSTSQRRAGDPRPRMALAVMQRAASQLCQDRDHAQRAGLHAPGPAEYLDLLRALDRLAHEDEAGQQRWLEELSAYAFVKSAALNPAEGDATLTQARPFTGQAGAEPKPTTP